MVVQLTWRHRLALLGVLAFAVIVAVLYPDAAVDLNRMR